MAIHPFCPHCNAPVSKKRLWFKATLNAKWPCPNCQKTLGFNLKRKLITASLSVALVASIIAIMLYTLEENCLVFFICLPFALVMIGIGVPIAFGVLAYLIDEIEVKN